MKILKCPKCSKYTLKDFCCEKTIRPISKYSPEDKYAHYRRKQKEIKNGK